MACSVQGRPKKARQAKRKVKSILIIFFAIKGIVHKDLSWQAKQSIPHITVMFYGDCVETLPRTLATKVLAVASQRTVSHLFFSPGKF
jgi:hypothetical protein